MPEANLDSKKQLQLDAEELRIRNAITWINNKTKSRVYRDLVDIGEFLLQYFFNNNPSEASSYSPTKQLSFKRLARHPQLTMHRTTLQHAVKIALLRREGILDDLDYLTNSHFIALLPLYNISQELFRNVALEANYHKWSVRRIKSEVKQYRGLTQMSQKRVSVRFKQVKEKMVSILDTSINGDEALQREVLIEIHKCIEILMEKSSFIRQNIAKSKINRKEDVPKISYGFR